MTKDQSMTLALRRLGVWVAADTTAFNEHREFAITRTWEGRFDVLQRKADAHGMYSRRADSNWPHRALNLVEKLGWEAQR
jgi:hypothetical protein